MRRPCSISLGLVVSALSHSRTPVPKELPQLPAVYDLRQELSLRTLVVCAEGGTTERMESSPLRYSFDDPKDPNNESYAAPLAYDNQLKFKRKVRGVVGLDSSRWYGISAWLHHPVNRDPGELKLLKRAAKTFDCPMKTTGTKVSSGDIARYRRLIDSADRVGLHGLIDEPGRYWLGVYAEFIDPMRRRAEGFYRARLRVFDTLERRWSAPETLGTDQEALFRLEMYSIGRGMILLYQLRDMYDKPSDPEDAQLRFVSRLRTFRPATGDFHDALSTQWTIGLSLFDSDKDGFYDVGLGRGQALKEGDLPTWSGLVWNDSLQSYVDIGEKRRNKNKSQIK